MARVREEEPVKKKKKTTTRSERAPLDSIADSVFVKIG